MKVKLYKLHSHGINVSKCLYLGGINYPLQALQIQTAENGEYSLKFVNRSYEILIRSACFTSDYIVAYRVLTNNNGIVERIHWHYHVLLQKAESNLNFHDWTRTRSIDPAFHILTGNTAPVTEREDYCFVHFPRMLFRHLN